MPLYTCTNLYKVVENAQGDDNRQEDGCTVADHDDGADHRKERVHPAPQHVRQDVIDSLYVSGESIQDAADWSSVKERHGRAQDVIEQIGVKFPRCPDHGYSSDDGVDQHEQG